MSGDVDREGNERDAGVVEEICGYLTESPPRSFFLFAGAGSGKTRTLVEVLRRLTGVEPHPKGGELARTLRLFGRSIRVITFTKNAVSVINGRLGNNELVNVSTIHSFCWELIEGFNDDIRDALVAIKTEQLESLQRSTAAKDRGASPSERARLAELAVDIEGYLATQVFRYHPDRNTYGAGAIQHRHVLDATAWLLLNRPTLRTILRDRHPIVLIDESQDTMKGILDALMVLAESSGRGLTLGLLGDHRQRIYMDGHADLPGLVPDDWAKPELRMNHRSQLRIVSLINNVWDAKLQGRAQHATGVKQHARTEKTGGVVRVFVGDGTLPPAQKVLHEKQCALKMTEPTASSVWSEGGYQILALEHKLVATRGSFLDVYQAMELIDPDAAAPAGSGENKGPSATRFLLGDLAQLVGCATPDGGVDEYAATEVLQRARVLDSMPFDAEQRRARQKSVFGAIVACITAANRHDAKVADVLEPILGLGLFEVHPALVGEFADKSPAPPPPIPRREQETKEARRRRGWCALFSSPWAELGRYRRYLEGQSELATHQVVKGSEFDHVMVVMDDVQAGGFLISYDKVFGAKALSDTDRSNAETGKETTIDRSLRLLYVTCSRARDSLALVLWSVDPTEALASIRKSGWFSPEEIVEIP